MWSRNHKYCKSCKSTYYKHVGHGFCVQCYKVDRAKKKLRKEINGMTTPEFFQIKRPELHHSYWSNDDPKEIREALLARQEYKLYNLKLYGQLEQGGDLDLLGFEELFNDLASKFGKSRYFYDHQLNSLHSSLSKDQIRLLAMGLLKMRLWKK